MLKLYPPQEPSRTASALANISALANSNCVAAPTPDHHCQLLAEWMAAGIKAKTTSQPGGRVRQASTPASTTPQLADSSATAASEHSASTLPLLFAFCEETLGCKFPLPALHQVGSADALSFIQTCSRSLCCPQQVLIVPHTTLLVREQSGRTCAAAPARRGGGGDYNLLSVTELGYQTNYSACILSDALPDTCCAVGMLFRCMCQQRRRRASVLWPWACMYCRQRRWSTAVPSIRSPLSDTSTAQVSLHRSNRRLMRHL